MTEMMELVDKYLKTPILNLIKNVKQIRTTMRKMEDIKKDTNVTLQMKTNTISKIRNVWD